MTTASKRSHKHFQLDSSKIKRAQRALHAKTETEAIDRALDFAIAEHEKNRLVLQTTELFIKSGIEVKDIYRTLVGYMQPALFDTSIYVSALRRGSDAALTPSSI